MEKSDQFSGDFCKGIHDVAAHGTIDSLFSTIVTDKVEGFCETALSSRYDKKEHKNMHVEYSTCLDFLREQNKNIYSQHYQYLNKYYQPFHQFAKAQSDAYAQRLQAYMVLAYLRMIKDTTSLPS